MINSVNTLEFLKPKLISMDKFNATSATRIHHPSSLAPPTRTYLTFVTSSTAETIQPTIVGMQQQQQQQLTQHQPMLRQERVKVQHLENHTKLQNNNCWNNFRTLLSASSCGGGVDSVVGINEMPEDKEFVLEVDDMQHTINIQNKSAFNLELNKRNIYSNINNNNNYNINKKLKLYDNSSNSSSFLPAMETNNNHHFYFKHHQQQQQHPNGGYINKQPQQKTMMVLLPRRTEDQEHAYRRIESVHNYAKLKSYDDDAETHDPSPNGSRHSSYLDDEEDEGDDDDEEEDDNNDADYDAEEDEMIDLDDADYEDIFNRRRYPKLSTSSGDSPRQTTKKSPNFVTSQKIQSQPYRGKDEDTDIHVDVDVETVEHQTIEMNNNIGASESPVVKPDHHARRPMNAFLIFCKRHRAIVKERYKTLENRAITKILGDWWASLEITDKKCFTNLAQQNKDAFFSANPNFKWYKLPAPPLRTLNTRPTNCNITGSGCGGVEYEDNTFITAESISNNTRSNTNYFKLADEAQMGDLSQLMQDKSKTKQCALQLALGETSQFMRSHITGSVEAEEEKQQLKRRFYSENSFSSNSSEEDGLVPKKKSARSCKGKIYQELINSGQITAPAVKKSKSSQRLTSEVNTNQCLEAMDMELKVVHTIESSGHLNNPNNIGGAIGSMIRSTSESDNIFSYDLAGFDLEEKIKELPALSLDDYLQRKRNTKKKKKFSSNGKKRGSRSNIPTNSSSNACNVSQSKDTILNTTSQPISPVSDNVSDARVVLQRKQQQAVGSQKRKARKESITRRDVSAIEQEVASLLPLTINGCCYFQEASLPLSPVITNPYKNATIEKDTNSTTNTSLVESFEQTSPPPIIPLTTTTASSLSPPQLSPESIVTVGELMGNTLNDNIISSTSDLLILAEVAANRTELKH